MANTQDLRRKIKSIRSTSKLTKAMQMVAAAKMARAIARATASRAYASALWAVVQRLTAQSELQHPLLEQKAVGKTALVVITSNRGLAGSFNSQVIRSTVAQLDEETDLIVVGRKGQVYFHRFHKDQVVAEFAAADSLPDFTDATAIARLVTAGFLDGHYRQVLVAYTQFESRLRQVPKLEALLPIQPDLATAPATSVEFVFEPSPSVVLDTVLARSIPLRLFQMLLESSASEHSARMLAMKNATDNANEIVDDLTLTYQSVRQAGITRQIIEIASGAAALGA